MAREGSRGRERERRQELPRCRADRPLPCRGLEVGGEETGRGTPKLQDMLTDFLFGQTVSWHGANGPLSRPCTWKPSQNAHLSGLGSAPNPREGEEVDSEMHPPAPAAMTNTWLYPLASCSRAIWPRTICPAVGGCEIAPALCQFGCLTLRLAQLIDSQRPGASQGGGRDRLAFPRRQDSGREQAPSGVPAPLPTATWAFAYPWSLARLPRRTNEEHVIIPMPPTLWMRKPRLQKSPWLGDL